MIKRLRAAVRRPPIWREAGFALEVATLLRDPVYTRPPLPREPQAVMLIPGFMTGDRYLVLMKRWLERAGHSTCDAGMRLNVDCSAAAVSRLETRLARFADECNGPVTIIGQSRGGLFARVLAVRRPDLVKRIVTLGSPHVRPFAVHPLIMLHGAWITLAGTLGVPGVATHTCRAGDCCTDFTLDLAGSFPDEVDFVTVYSKRDGFVEWRACLDEAARAVEVRSSHCGMGGNVDTYRLLSVLLAPETAADLRLDSWPQAA